MWGATWRQGKRKKKGREGKGKEEKGRKGWENPPLLNEFMLTALAAFLLMELQQHAADVSDVSVDAGDGN